jgi:hypothetical protein
MRARQFQRKADIHILNYWYYKCIDCALPGRVRMFLGCLLYRALAAVGKQSGRRER